MPPIELAERLPLLLALASFLELAFEEIYEGQQPFLAARSISFIRMCIS
jgi:hypothetical protein